MENMLKELRTFYLMASVPPLAFFGLFYLSAGEPLVGQRVDVVLLTVLYLAAFLAVLVTNRIMAHAEGKCDGVDAETRFRVFGKAYRVRIVVMNVLSFCSGVAYLLTVNSGCAYLVGLISVLVLMSYPSRQYILRDSE